MPVEFDKRAGSGDASRHERVPVLIFDSPEELSYRVARHIATLVESRRAAGKNVVLGLPTGSTPIGVYQHLVEMHRKEGLDLSNVITFNLDEYFPMEPDSLQSYHRFMRENFFDHVNIPEGNIHIPDGALPREHVEQFCLEYEHKIHKAGGIDVVMLGIGRSGHIGFNEPGSDRSTRTRLIVLDEITRKDAASDFFGEEFVPRQAITMGVETILEAREVILMATGEHKAGVIRRAVEEPESRVITASFLQSHPNVSFYVDRAAASGLTREATPWVVRNVQWNEESSKRAVVWLSEQVDRAILRLERQDFHRHHLHELSNRYDDDVDQLSRTVFEDLRGRIVYPEQLFKGERTILFSPHPDDDVISMGGMLDQVVRNGNEMTVAYMTNGSVAVFESDVRRYLRFVELSAEMFGFSEEQKTVLRDNKQKFFEYMAAKKPGQVDEAEVQHLKASIRYGEAIAGIEVMGLSDENARFLDLPFYRTGRVKKAPVGEADYEIILDLLREKQPHHVFVAGDLSDPHGTHRMCYQAIKEALRRYNAENGIEPGTINPSVACTRSGAPKGKGWKQPLVWLYRGAWQEWEIHRADVFLPMSKRDLDRKIEAIFKHESQKDRAMFPGAYDSREFWERARDRNIDTATALNKLGLPEFYAAEAFVTVYDM